MEQFSNSLCPDNGKMMPQPLSNDGIDTLTAQGCTADNWNNVRIHPATDLQYIRHVHFQGQVTVGLLNGVHTLKGGLTKHSALLQVTLKDVVVGNDCYLHHTAQGIANCHIGDGCYLENVALITGCAQNACGSGTAVAVLSETGGREVMLHRNLSAQEAYAQAFYRYDAGLTEQLQKMAQQCAEQETLPYTLIGDGCHLTNVGTVENCNLQHTHLNGTTRLTDCGCYGTETSAIHIGENVIMEHVIAKSGTHIESGANLCRCFVGQSCIIGHGYTASDMVAFSNCQMENGEACAVFAGPFSVTHHKSTLLIGGMFSFYNAGSGTNQSNHAYKLGPHHQGVLQRGSKTASGSHLLWPAHIGAFTMVMGKHASHPDTTPFPYSYLIDNQGTPFLVPGAALTSVGTERDSVKWPKRDGRPSAEQYDVVNPAVLSPYALQQALKGRQLLKDLLAAAPYKDVYEWKGIKLRHSSLVKGISLYEWAIGRYLYEMLDEPSSNTELEAKDACTCTAEACTEQMESSAEACTAQMESSAEACTAQMEPSSDACTSEACTAEACIAEACTAQMESSSETCTAEACTAQMESSSETCIAETCIAEACTEQMKPSSNACIADACTAQMESSSNACIAETCIAEACTEQMKPSSNACIAEACTAQLESSSNACAAEACTAQLESSSNACTADACTAQMESSSNTELEAKDACTCTAETCTAEACIAQMEPSSNACTATNPLSSGKMGTGEWCDFAGMLLPAELLKEWKQRWTNGTFASPIEAQQFLQNVNQHYKEYARNWCQHLRANPGDMQLQPNDCKAAYTTLLTAIRKDAAKEFNEMQLISFGLDGDEQDARNDLQAVRGSLESQNFVKEYIDQPLHKIKD